jgi:hypothetical protein
MSKQDGRNSPVSELPGAITTIVKDSVDNVFERSKDNTKKIPKGQVPEFGKPPKGGRKRRKTRRKRRKSRRKRRKSRRKRRKSRRKKKR